MLAVRWTRLSAILHGRRRDRSSRAADQTHPIDLCLLALQGARSGGELDLLVLLRAEGQHRVRGRVRFVTAAGNRARALVLIRGDSNSPGNQVLGPRRPVDLSALHPRRQPPDTLVPPSCRPSPGRRHGREPCSNQWVAWRAGARGGGGEAQNSEEQPHAITLQGASYIARSFSVFNPQSIPNAGCAALKERTLDHDRRESSRGASYQASSGAR